MVVEPENSKTDKLIIYGRNGFNDCSNVISMHTLPLLWFAIVMTYYSPKTVRFPSLEFLPIMFVASHLYLPASPFVIDLMSRFPLGSIRTRAVSSVLGFNKRPFLYQTFSAAGADSG